MSAHARRCFGEKVLLMSLIALTRLILTLHKHETIPFQQLVPYSGAAGICGASYIYPHSQPFSLKG
jgi:hypothetical protein